MSRSVTIILIISAIALVVVVLVSRWLIKAQSRRKYPLKVHQKWLNVQRLCANKETWNLAISDADKLLEEVLKKMRYKGKSIGERLVAAQRKLTDNDAVWYAHNLSKKLKENPTKRLRESDVKKALIGFRQALRDLGALNDK